MAVSSAQPAMHRKWKDIAAGYRQACLPTNKQVYEAWLKMRGLGNTMQSHLMISSNRALWEDCAA